jgi:penicillin-binding protein 2
MSVFNQSRSTIIRLIFIGMFVVIALQLFNLQVLSGKYQQLAMENALFPKRIYPSRGIIYDRKGKSILDNTILYDLIVIPTEAKTIDTASFCRMMEIDTVEYNKRMRNITFKNGWVRPSIFEDLLTPILHARLVENIWKYKGFYLQDRPVRTYPFNSASHIMGYVGEVDSAILRRSNYFYQLGDYVGRSGLEQYYESVLMGRRGVQYMLRDNKNRIVGRYENGKYDTAAIAGRNLRTYIDIELQQLAEKLMTNKVGAVVALEPKTGGIIAMCSGPNFNPNDLTGPEKQKNYQRLVLDVSGPLLNRAIKGLYPPGSAYKPLGALVALNDGIIDPGFGYPCGGRYLACGHGKPACTHRNPGHAANLRLSIANSCNSYYAHVYRMTVDNPRFKGVKKGYAHWREYANHFGLGERLGVDLPSEDKGNIPDTSVYNRVYRGSWNSCTNLTLGIGQDMMLATPLQLANVMCIVANKGYYYTPHFVSKFDNETEEDTILNKFRRKHEVLTRISDTAFEAVIGGMQDVVERGTATNAKIPGINICAKTGTAENFRILDGRRVQLKDNSVFVCFAPRENPRIAIAVVVENAGFGSTWAGPIASLMMEKYLNDTLRAERVKEVERIAAANLMPSWLEREQYKADSARAAYWANLTKDSTGYMKYLKRGYVAPRNDTIPKVPKKTGMQIEGILNDKNKLKPVNA